MPSRGSARIACRRPPTARPPSPILCRRVRTRHQDTNVIRRTHMKDFRGRLAVITGAGTGMGRELALQLTAEGCHVALCDVSADAMAETKRLCEAQMPAGTRVTTHLCDVSDEKQMLAFRDAVKTSHGTERINLLFNNAGIGGGGSMLADDRADWDKTFGVCWGGVYYGTRAFLPMLVASDEA